MTHTEKQQEVLPSKLHGDKSAGLRLLLGPFIGLAYVIALPFLAIGTVLTLLGKKLVDGILAAFGYIVSFGWRPTEAYFAGRKRHAKKENRKDGRQG